MEKMLCSSCCAALPLQITHPFLRCEYCGTSVANPFYDAAAAAPAEKPTLAKLSLTALQELGTAQKLAQLDPNCFGNPINGIDAARAGLSIPDDQQVYLLYAHTFLFLAFSDGFALTDGGLYYEADGQEGSLSWEAFITGPVSCVDRTDAQEGTLKIGSGVSLPVKSEKDSRLARFLVDFHNHVYRQHTGETAPATWAVTEPVAAVKEEEPTLLDTVLPGLGALLGGSNKPRQTVLRRTPTLHPTSRPSALQDRRAHVQPPRPLHSQPHHRPVSPGMQRRPGSMGGPGGPGHSGKPGRPGGPGRSGGPGRR